MNERWDPDKRRAYQNEWIKRPEVRKRKADYLRLWRKRKKMELPPIKRGK